MSNLLSGFQAELIKLASDGSPVPFVLTKNPGAGELNRALREVKKETKSDSAWKKIRTGGAPVHRNYLASMLIGAAAAPAMGIMGKGVSRLVRNRALIRAAAKAGDEAKSLELMGRVERGPLIGRFKPDATPGEKATVDTTELLGRAASGAMTGSLIQGIRDHFSGGHH